MADTMPAARLRPEAPTMATFLFSADDSTFAADEREMLNDAASALLLARPAHVEAEEWRKAVADALTNAWSADASADDLADAAAAALGVARA